jgi:fibronectin-binding autotransporter adhesin
MPISTIAGAAFDATGTGTGALLMPSGTTAQRPASPIVGMQRWNTTTSSMEIYIGTGSTGWQTISSSAYAIDYLIVAGGGSGGMDMGGGGGAGGYLASTNYSVSPGTAYTVVVGAGGAPTVNVYAANARGASGSNTSVTTLGTAIGGGGGASRYDANTYPAASGGSGGGASGNNANWGAGTAGQGNNGGTTSGQWYPGGGGGAGGPGLTAPAKGGDGIYNAITGTGYYWAGGGGGGGYTGAAGNGGLGGAGGGGGGTAIGTAGASGYNAGTAGSGTGNTGPVGGNAGPNTGSGGGGGAHQSSGTGNAGGSGIVVIRYAGTVARATGGTINIAGGYVVHIFTTSGTFTA